MNKEAIDVLFECNEENKLFNGWIDGGGKIFEGSGGGGIKECPFTFCSL